MHLLGNCVLIFGLAALVIIGFLRVVRDLMSRDIFEAPSSSNEGPRSRITDDSGQLMSVNSANSGSLYES